MRQESQKTKLTTLMHYVNLWKQRVGSRESVAIAIVESHYELGLDIVTGITFDTRGDSFKAAKTAADRIFRWLDDQTKEGVLMPANFELSILAAMPQDLVLQYLNESLCVVGFVATPKVSCVGGESCFTTITQKQHKESSEATTANMSIGPNSTLEELEAAKKENLETLAKVQLTLGYLSDRIDLIKYGVGAVR